MLPDDLVKTVKLRGPAEAVISKLCEDLDYPDMFYTRKLMVPDNYMDPSNFGCTQGSKALQQMLAILKIPR